MTGMYRDLARLSTEPFDLVIVGGGIYGACVAWEAVLRGLSVALLEQGDFGQATSANSQKIVHGGFRYLQHADLKRMRESIRERRALMRVAPHLVHRLPCLIPTYRWGIQSRAVMRAALALYDLVSWDRNRGIADPGKRIPHGRLVSRQECLRLAPGLATRGLTGGAIWHDGQVYNSERLTHACVRSAADQGACVANYVRVTGLLHQGHRVVGIRASDALSGRTLEVLGRLVINTAGPWVNRVLGLAPSGPRTLELMLTKTMNVITPALTNGHAVSVVLPSQNGHGGSDRRLYITPWRGRAIIGCAHLPFDGHPDDCQVAESEIAAFLKEINTAYPGAGLRPEDVSFVHLGLLPRQKRNGDSDPAHLARGYRICDHKREQGIDGLVSVVGVKYTTARDVAEKTVDLALRKLGRPIVRSRSATTPVCGGRISELEAFYADVLRKRPYGLADDVLRQLVLNHGSDYTQVLRLVADCPDGLQRLGGSTAVIQAQVRYAVREEMAQALQDVVFQRTELGTLGHPGHEALESCAAVMAQELGWDARRLAQELDETEQAFARHAGKSLEAAGCR